MRKFLQIDERNGYTDGVTQHMLDAELNSVDLAKAQDHTGRMKLMGSLQLEQDISTLFPCAEYSGCQALGNYRLLPESFQQPKCSGRDELCQSVLNDQWVSFPTWASEDDTTGTTTKRNTYSEYIHKVEDERFEVRRQESSL